MQLKQMMQSYRAGWEELEKVQKDERRNASFELRWRQLNSAHGLIKGLGLHQTDPDKMKVIQRWANLKEKTINQKMKA